MTSKVLKKLKRKARQKNHKVKRKHTIIRKYFNSSSSNIGYFPINSSIVKAIGNEVIRPVKKMLQSENQKMLDKNITKHDNKSREIGLEEITPSPDGHIMLSGIVSSYRLVYGKRTTLIFILLTHVYGIKYPWKQGKMKYIANHIWVDINDFSVRKVPSIYEIGIGDVIHLTGRIGAYQGLLSSKYYVVHGFKCCLRSPVITKIGYPVTKGTIMTSGIIDYQHHGEYICKIRTDHALQLVHWGHDIRPNDRKRLEYNKKYYHIYEIGYHHANSIINMVYAPINYWSMSNDEWLIMICDNKGRPKRLKWLRVNEATNYRYKLLISAGAIRHHNINTDIRVIYKKLRNFK